MFIKGQARWAIDLGRESQRREHLRAAAVRIRRGIDPIHISGQRVGDEGLFEEPPEHDPRTLRGERVIEVARVRELRKEAGRALDQAGDQLRKE